MIKNEKILITGASGEVAQPLTELPENPNEALLHNVA